jgi:hypothetical protein
MALAVLPLENDNANHENVSFHYLPKENLGDAPYISIFRVLDLRIDEIAALLLYYYSVPKVLLTLLTIYNPQIRHHNEPILEAIILQYQQDIVLIRVHCGSQFHET